MGQLRRSSPTWIAATTAKSMPVVMCSAASAPLSGKAKMPAGLVENAAQIPVTISAAATKIA
jgi:hypothetical protein